jgi:hypothetical protein
MTKTEQSVSSQVHQGLASVESRTGAAWWCHPRAVPLAGGGAQIDPHGVLSRVRRCVATPTVAKAMAQTKPVSIVVGHALRGSAAMPALCPTPDLNISVKMHMVFAQGFKGKVEAHGSMAGIVQGIIRKAVDCSERFGLAFVQLATPLNNSLAQFMNIPATNRHTWSRGEIEKGVKTTEKGEIGLIQALSLSAISTMIFLTDEPVPRVCEVHLDASFEAPGGLHEFNVGPTLMWFGHLTDSKQDAERFMQAELIMGRRYPNRYRPQTAFLSANAPTLAMAARSGEWTKFAKRLAANAAFVGDEAGVEALRAFLGGPVGEAHASAGMAGVLGVLGEQGVVRAAHGMAAATEAMMSTAAEAGIDVPNVARLSDQATAVIKVCDARAAKVLLDMSDRVAKMTSPAVVEAIKKGFTGA